MGYKRARLRFTATAGEGGVSGTPLEHLKGILDVVREIVFNQEELQIMDIQADNQLAMRNPNSPSNKKGQNHTQDRKSQIRGKRR